MENEVEEQIEKLMSQPGVKGAMFVDNEGLCIAYRGALKGENTASHIAALTKQALIVTDPPPEIPVISVNYSNGYLLISQHQGYTVALLKQSNSAADTAIVNGVSGNEH